MRVMELARREQVNANTIRHYVRIGLLNPDKDDSGYHRFTAAEHKRLRFILQARDLGFTLEDIQTMLQAAEQGESPCPTVRQLIEPRLNEARARLAAMQALVGRMERAVELWAMQPDCMPCGDHICHLIEGADVHLNEHCGRQGEGQHD
ncbi:MAG: MerR family DNA-binding protein [Saccharospirillaceae bacterium]|nr:MerR family DNA-binding protein [Saccharospirillaceae bacterium]MCD8531232.1 MerR family DNA-binding protein [Saccharospirillaceae bacterium]